METSHQPASATSATITYRRPPWWLRSIVSRIAPRIFRDDIAMLSVRGRTSGKVRSVPVVVLRFQGERYLVTPYGEAHWVRNLRAAGGAGTLTMRGQAQPFTAVEIPPQDRQPILHAYLREYGSRPTVARTFAQIPEAADHPTFRIVETRS
ncbi:nitroreductase family deazaflavin-dependent oxidoreductase [Actinomadura sp. 7K534]|uniref:nitroreductase family deazaflavin-dependent oxidoreductase n=1 Tax=Actinomadura sp. 7K534 TaxID=2530366 RepID=UPI001A9E0F6D|nr:nitroreductase family deazaflavin-dependent oxidoreductase [Actinomadura sp. 7K534]